MTTENNTEDEARSNGALNPQFYSRLYPSGWDLSEHCRPQEDVPAQETNPDKEETLSAAHAPDGSDDQEDFPYESSPRVFQFPSGWFHSDTPSDPF